jgi:tRNA/rRNA methyltransferase
MVISVRLDSPFYPNEHRPWAMVNPRLAAIRIVLVEPAGPLNVGSVARVMANMGLSQLVLVNPQCDPDGEEAQRMAVHAGDLLRAATIVATLPEALVGCRRAIATTARTRTLGPPLESPEAVLPWLVTPTGEPTALIFGPEDRGLSNQELNYAQRWLGIPSDPAYASLNLAQAVAVCAYELARVVRPRSPSSISGSDAALSSNGTATASQSPAPDPTPPITSPSPPPPISPSSPPSQTAPLDQMEGFYGQMEALLLQIGYLYPHTCASRMEKLRHFFNRSAPTEQELAMLRGLLRQMNWALGDAAQSPQAFQPSQGEPD